MTIKIRCKPMYAHTFCNLKVESFTGLNGFAIRQAYTVITRVRICSTMRLFSGFDIGRPDTIMIAKTGNDMTTGFTYILCRKVSTLKQINCVALKFGGDSILEPEEAYP